MARTFITGEQIKDDDLTFDDIADGAVRGATANGGVEREIALGTVSDIDLRDDAVIPSKLQDTGAFDMASLGLATGSAASPALHVKTDTNTGVYSPNADQFSVSAGGTEILRFLGAGIQLGVNGAAASPSLSWLGNTDEGLYHTGSDSFGLVAVGVERARIKSGAVELRNSAVLQLTAGAVGTPSLSFATDTNTGAFLPVADTLAFTTGGVEAARIDSAQRVGIGGSPATGAILTLTTTDKALLLPRLTTTQRDAVTSPADGMIVFNTTTGTLQIYSTGWGEVTATETDPLSIHLNGDNSPTAAVDWNQQELQQMVVHKLSSDPVSPAEGQLWYNTTTKQWKGFNGTSNVILG